MPGPWSRTSRRPSRTRTSTGSGGRGGRVPFARVVEQVRDRAIQTRGSGAHQAGLGVEREVHGRPPARAVLRARSPRLRPGPGGRPRSRSPRPRSWTGRPGRRRARSARAAVPVRPRSHERARARASRSPSASASRLACTLVSGVRSSCEASETSWRWARRERSSAASMVLKLRPAVRARPPRRPRCDGRGPVCAQRVRRLPSAGARARAPRVRRAARARPRARCRPGRRSRARASDA